MRGVGSKHRPDRAGTRRPRALLLAVACMSVVSHVPQEAVGQESGTVFASLEGTWVGTGTLLGRPGVFEMEWQARPNGFVRLTFSNGWRGEDGATQRVMSAEATYRVQGSSAIGVWVDSRPQQLRLTATLTDETLVTEWVAETESGRTEYRVKSVDEVVVRDWVRSGGELRPFGEATYRRAEQRPGAQEEKQP